MIDTIKNQWRKCVAFKFSKKGLQTRLGGSFIVVFTLISCSSAPYQVDQSSGAIESEAHGIVPHQPHPEYQVRNVPLSSNWQNFRCREGQFAARFANGQKSVQVRYLGQEQTLHHRPSNDPVIYENSQLAIFADEERIMLARPKSSQIFLSQCQRQ